MSNRSDFKRIRRIRLCWVWGLTIATIILFVCLLLTWMEVHWWIFPLEGFVVDIFENLFFSFTTGTIMMWFQSSIDGYAQMREEYKEIELNTKALPNIRLDVFEDYVKPSLKLKTEEISVEDCIEINDDSYVISEYVKVEDYLSFREFPKNMYTKEEWDGLYLNYEKGYFKNVEHVVRQFYKWKNEIDIQIIRKEFNKYIESLEKSIGQIIQNEYYYNPDKPDILEVVQEFFKVFFYRLRHEGDMDFGEGEDESYIHMSYIKKEFEKTRKYINSRYKIICVEEMKQLLNELRSMGEGYVKNGRWILDIDEIEDREATKAKQLENPDEVVFPVMKKYKHEKTMFLYRYEWNELWTDYDEYGNESAKVEVSAKKAYPTGLSSLAFVTCEDEDEYLAIPPDCHTMNPYYLADIYLRMKKFECLVDNYNREYQTDKRAMRKTFERKYRKKRNLSD